MKKLIELAKQKLNFLKKDVTKNEILENDIKFLEEYQKFLDLEDVQNLDEINTSKYKKQLKELKELVGKVKALERQINTIEKNKIKTKTKKMSKRMKNSYEKFKKD